MKFATQRTLCRWIHLVFSIPIIGYIYSPFERLPDYAGPTRYVFFPVLAASGLWMWKGQRLMRALTRGPSPAGTNSN